MAEFHEILRKATELGASDIFAIAGAPVTVKVDGQMNSVDDKKLLPPDTLSLITIAYKSAGREINRLFETGDDDFSFAVPGLARFRVNAYRQRGSFAMVIRIVSFDVPTPEKRHIPQQVVDLAGLTSGMVIIAGTAGSGKSTTQACIIDKINSTRSCHIITLEDPIEYLHRDKLSIISQREIAIDTTDCASALRACLRQAPDVIQVGEMRDTETISAAVTAAETGHLLLATLHTKGAVNTIDRIIDTFVPAQQPQIRIQLSSVLNTVVSQQLLPCVDGSRIPAFEIMHVDSAIRSMIRDSRTHQINGAIATGAAKGMISMDQYILNLYREGKISARTAVDYADDPDAMCRKIN